MPRMQINSNVNTVTANADTHINIMEAEACNITLAVQLK